MENTALAFPRVELDDAAQANAGRIEVTIDLVEKALDRIDKLDAEESPHRGKDRLTADPLD
jgi:hypothetical protein